MDSHGLSRTYFHYKMKLSSSVSNASMTASCSAIPEQLNCPLYESFNCEGWALPGRSIFRFNKGQKKYCGSFLWTVNRVGTPDKVHMLL